MLARLRLFGRLARVRPRFAVGYVIVALVVLLAILAPLIAPYSPTEADTLNFLQPPSAAHVFGTDNVGMDIFSRAIYAPRIDLTIAILGTVFSALLGSSLGALVGYYSSGRGVRVWLSYVMMRAADVLQALPRLRVRHRAGWRASARASRPWCWRSPSSTPRSIFA